MTVRELKDIYGGIYKTPLTQRDFLSLEVDPQASAAAALLATGTLASEQPLVDTSSSGLPQDSMVPTKGVFGQGMGRRTEQLRLEDDNHLYQFRVQYHSILTVVREKPDPDFLYSCARMLLKEACNSLKMVSKYII